MKKKLTPQGTDLYALAITVGGGGTLVVMYLVYLLALKIIAHVANRKGNTVNDKVKIGDAYMVDENFAGFVMQNGGDDND